MTPSQPDFGPAFTPPPANVEAALVRLEGKIDRVIDGFARQAEDMKTVRERLHDHANHITSLNALNIPEKLTALRDGHEDHELRLRPIELEIGKVATCVADLAVLRTDLEQRRGAVAAIKVLWGLIGAIGAGGLLAILKLVAHV